jgi:hypothetical protein
LVVVSSFIEAVPPLAVDESESSYFLLIVNAGLLGDRRTISLSSINTIVDIIGRSAGDS